MSLFNQMKQTKDKVRLLLQQIPKLRDNDYKLMATYYVNELGGEEKVKKMNAYEFLTLFAEAKITHPETIRRNRASIQATEPELRGTTYTERKEEGAKVASEITA